MELRVWSRLGFLLLFCMACRPETSPTPKEEAETGTPTSTTVRPADGHQRMVILLKRISDEAATDNRYLGDGKSSFLRVRLAALSAGQPDQRLWRLHKLLGESELHLGHEEQALQHHLEAYRLLQAFRDVIPEDKMLETIFEMGVAHMRVAETQNCALRHTSESCILPIKGGGVHVRQEPSKR